MGLTAERAGDGFPQAAGYYAGITISSLAIPSGNKCAYISIPWERFCL